LIDLNETWYELYVIIGYLTCVPINSILSTQQGHLKRWYPTTSLYGVTTQKTTTWILIVVKN